MYLISQPFIERLGHHRITNDGFVRKESLRGTLSPKTKGIRRRGPAPAIARAAGPTRAAG
jgi:hypothetical protein